MKKVVASICILVFSFCLFANQTNKAQPSSTAEPDALIFLSNIAKYDKAIADKKAPWETEEEFTTRMLKDIDVIQLIQQMDTYKKKFSRDEYYVGFDKTEVKVFPFDAENKQFLIEITSRDNLLPFHATLYYKITTNDFEAIGREYSRIDDAYKANALVASIGYTVTETLPNFWEIKFTHLNLYSRLESDSTRQGHIKTYVSEGIKRTDEDRLLKLHKGEFIPLYAIVPINATADSQDASIIVDDKVIGVGSVIYEIVQPLRSIYISGKSKNGATGKIPNVVTRGINPLVEIGVSRVGEKGPAGGYIFYNKGYVSNGWQYLEAAPTRWSGSWRDPTYEFGYYRPSGINREVGTYTSIGSGKTNTEALVKAMGNKTYTSSGSKKVNYAAKAASDYTIRVQGVIYNDWFLPSLDELNMMYINLSKRNLGDLSYEAYWSSSEDSGGSARKQDFIDGEQDYQHRDYAYSVRPIRAF